MFVASFFASFELFKVLIVEVNLNATQAISLDLGNLYFYSLGFDRPRNLLSTENGCFLNSHYHIDCD